VQILAFITNPDLLSRSARPYRKRERRCKVVLWPTDCRGADSSNDALHASSRVTGKPEVMPVLFEDVEQACYKHLLESGRSCPETPLLPGTQVTDSVLSEFTVLDARKELFVD
jgi:hypothetical protein